MQRAPSLKNVYKIFGYLRKKPLAIGCFFGHTAWYTFVMRLLRFFVPFFTFVITLPIIAEAQTFRDVTSTTYEKQEIGEVVAKGWMKGASTSTFGYGTAIHPDDWLFLLMFLRTADACPELGSRPTDYWTTANIRACLSGAGVPTAFVQSDRVRRDEAMQELFALRRRSFAFTQLETRPTDFVDPLDLKDAPTNRQGALIAADRLKLLFRSKNHIFPDKPLLREDAALAVSRFVRWEEQGGVEKETQDTKILSKDVTLHHWRDLDTDIYVVRVKTGGDAIVRPIIPSRSFNPAPDPKTEKLRDEFVYEPVSSLAAESKAIAAINGSYFNVSWPWGAFEDTSILNGKTILERTDRSTFMVCADGKMLIGKYDKKALSRLHCAPIHALGAGPLFLSNGDVVSTQTKEGFDEYTQWERRVGKNARTAIGLSRDRLTAYLIVVAGKSYPAFGRGGVTLGSFLKEKYPDIAEAMMYDGGSSTTLVANKELLVGMGVSGETSERAVISALGVFSKKTDALEKKAYLKEQLRRWDTQPVTIKVPKPRTAFPWLTAGVAKQKGQKVQLSGSRGSSLQVIDTGDGTQTFHLTFDLFANDATSSLILAKRTGRHERGWTIPTELHVINPKDKSDTDIIKLFKYLPESQRPDLKTLDVLTTRKSGVVLGDATGRAWFYYAKDRQLSPAIFSTLPKKPLASPPKKSIKK